MQIIKCLVRDLNAILTMTCKFYSQTFCVKSWCQNSIFMFIRCVGQQIVITGTLQFPPPCIKQYLCYVTNKQMHNKMYFIYVHLLVCYDLWKGIKGEEYGSKHQFLCRHMYPMLFMSWQNMPEFISIRNSDRI